MVADWQRPETLPFLETGELQVWRIDLAAVSRPDEIATRSLTSDEIARASQLREGMVRTQFVVARAALRVLLGHNLGLAPRDVPIAVGRYGKPEMPSMNDRGLHFNLAHSRTTAVIGLYGAGPVGIDLEYLDRETDVVEVARHAFSGAECLWLESIADRELRRRAFFRCWTRKEAVVKMDGRGLSLPLTSFEIPSLASLESSPIRVPDATSGSRRMCWVTDFSPGDAMTAAFAVSVPQQLLHMFGFPMAAV